MTELANRSLGRAPGDRYPTYPGYHLDHANHRQHSPALASLVQVLRHDAAAQAQAAFSMDTTPAHEGR